MSKTGKMTVQAASRIYSVTAKNGDGSVGKNTFGARAMSTAMGNEARRARRVEPSRLHGCPRSKSKIGLGARPGLHAKRTWPHMSQTTLST